MDEDRAGWEMEFWQVSQLDVHPFKCSNCKTVTPQVIQKTYDCQEVPDAPPEVWLVECQRCFEMRMIYPSERVLSKEDDIERCNQCGNYKMKSARCKVCRLASGQDRIKRIVFTGHNDLEVWDEI